MAKEIERKFLLKDLSVVTGLPGQHIVQGYLSAGRVVTRVRLIDDKSAFLTIKCPTLERGACDEFEYPIPLADAREMLWHCGARVVDKTRYELPAGDGLTFEVDIFHGLHTGLALVEVELPNIETPVVLPAWVGGEVTGELQYTNAYLSGQSAGA